MRFYVNNTENRWYIRIFYYFQLSPDKLIFLNSIFSTHLKKTYSNIKNFKKSFFFFSGLKKYNFLWNTEIIYVGCLPLGCIRILYEIHMYDTKYVKYFSCVFIQYKRAKLVIYMSRLKERKRIINKLRDVGLKSLYYYCYYFLRLLLLLSWQSDLDLRLI